MKLFYREMGEGSPLVILHGLYGSSDNWVTIGRELAKDFRVILVDQRNHGQSPHSTQHTYPSMVDDLTELIDCLGLERINLVGHSMGGKTAMLFAHRYPHRAKSLVVIDIAPTGYDSAKTAVGSGQRDLHSRIIAALSQLDLKVATSREQLDELLAISIPDQCVRLFLLKNVKRNDDGTFYWALNINTIANSMDALMGPIFSDEQKIMVTTPTLFVKGELSNYIRPDDEEWIRERFSSCTLQVIPNAGHWVHAEAPVALIALLKNFTRCIQ